MNKHDDPMMNIPTIRFELERFKYSMQAAFLDSSDELNRMVKNAMDFYCTPENLQKIITEQVSEHTNRAISEEIKSFYSHGEGRYLIRKMVVSKLKKELKEQADDYET